MAAAAAHAWFHPGGSFAPAQAAFWYASVSIFAECLHYLSPPSRGHIPPLVLVQSAMGVVVVISIRSFAFAGKTEGVLLQ